MRQGNITLDNTEFVYLSFEGPDRYSSAGGLGVRVSNISDTLASMGFPTHLFFIGDPEFDGEEVRHEGKLVLHRWCQWISRYYPNGVYEGENEKLYDFNESIPNFVVDKVIKPAIEHDKLVVVLGEEWHTAEVMCRIADILKGDGFQDRVVMFWNANNTFSFHRIDWKKLNNNATITTVSRYMKHIMWKMGLNPLIIPNGIPRCLLRKMDVKIADKVRQSFGADVVLCKVARWDPDKRWNMAVEAIARLKERGMRTLLLARGGMEPHGLEVMRNASSLGLTVREARLEPNSCDGYLAALREVASADIIDIKFGLPLDFLRFLFRAADGVLANSGHEPFGLVGLESMAVGGITFTGCTGEDYAIHFVNSFVLETSDPMEIVGYMTYLRQHPNECERIRRAARRTARYFTWETSLQNLISKLENQARNRGILAGKPLIPAPELVIDDMALSPPNQSEWMSANMPTEHDLANNAPTSRTLLESPRTAYQ
jgi:glycosyltransferase involved in cell wall biosynthesis